MSLRLLASKDGRRRLPAVEILRVTRTIRECIRVGPPRRHPRADPQGPRPVLDAAVRSAPDRSGQRRPGLDGDGDLRELEPRRVRARAARRIASARNANGAAGGAVRSRTVCRRFSGDATGRPGCACCAGGGGGVAPVGVRRGGAAAATRRTRAVRSAAAGRRGRRHRRGGASTGRRRRIARRRVARAAPSCRAGRTPCATAARGGLPGGGRLPGYRAGPAAACRLQRRCRTGGLMRRGPAAARVAGATAIPARDHAAARVAGRRDPCQGRAEAACHPMPRLRGPVPTAVPTPPLLPRGGGFAGRRCRCRPAADVPATTTTAPDGVLSRRGAHRRRRRVPARRRRCSVGATAIAMIANLPAAGTRSRDVQ